MNKAQRRRRKALNADRRRFHTIATARPGDNDRVGMVGFGATLLLMKLESLRLAEELEAAKRSNESEGMP